MFITTAAHAQTLDQTIAQALASSPELRALEAAVDEARANALLGNPFHSEATVSTTPGYATGLPIAVVGQVPAIGTVEAHRLIYDRSAEAEAIATGSQVDAAIARLESARRDVAQNTAAFFANVAAGPAHVAAAQRRVTALETIASRTEALRGEGRARDIDVDRAHLQVAIAQNALAKAQSRLELDRSRLSSLSGGQPPSAARAPTPAADRGAALITAEAVPNGQQPTSAVPSPMESDAELTSLDARIAALQHAADLQKARFQPSIAAQLQYSRLFDRYHRFYLNFKPDDFSAGATITLPIFTGGSRTATSARFAAQIEQLKAERDARRRAVDTDQREAADELRQATAEVQLAERGRAVAAEALRIAQSLAGEGRGEPNDVQQAEIALADADDDLANANAHLLTARARLSILHGAFRSDLKKDRK